MIMGSGWGVRHIYNGRLYESLAEAQWAAFFDAMNHEALYEAEGDWGIGNEEHYKPQFWVRCPVGPLYLEVSERWDQAARKPLKYDYPEVQEHHVYLAIGDLPDQQRVRHETWWYRRRKRTVLRLTPGPDWNELYPPGDGAVRRALDQAHGADIRPAVPLGRNADGTQLPLWDPIDEPLGPA